MSPLPEPPSPEDRSSGNSRNCDSLRESGRVPSVGGRVVEKVIAVVLLAVLIGLGVLPIGAALVGGTD